MSESNAKAGSWDILEPRLSPFVMEALAAANFSEMTPVQAATIPLFMKHKDVVVEAVTGSGKTLAFVIPIIEKLFRRKNRLAQNEIGALVITPTRELAQQISSVFSIFLDDHKPRHALIIGGTTTIHDDIALIRDLGPDIIIGTPGRLQDLLVGNGNTKSPVNTKELGILVLDEADRLLDMGFSQTLNDIIAHLPKQRSTGLFSATMTDGLAEVVRVGLRNPIRIVVKVENIISKVEQRTPATLHIRYIVCEPQQKLAQLLRLISRETIAKKYIVYFATCACVDYFYKIFLKLPQLKGISIYSFHGQMDTKRRIATYQAFVNLPPISPALLLCTDVAARGLDVPDVDFVIQMEPPQDPKVFAHRYFLKIRKIPLQRQPYILPEVNESVVKTSFSNDDASVVDEENDILLEQIQSIVLTDRDLYDKGIRAFVSYIRFYSKHDLNYIFRLKDLDLGKVAKGFCLIRLPKMPELKNYNIKFEEVHVNMDEYKYADKAREKSRLLKLTEEKSNLNSLPEKRQLRKVPKGPWSKKAVSKQRKLERKIKKEKKKEYVKKRKADETIDEFSEKKVKRDEDEATNNSIEDEWDELQKERKLIKKLKSGKINREEFDQEMASITEKEFLIKEKI